MESSVLFPRSHSGKTPFKTFLLNLKVFPDDHHISLTNSAMDIKELKILDIRNGNARKSTSASAHVGSAPVAVPKGDPRLMENVTSPQHCSKSYGERHLDVPGQPKAFRRRHNSCKCSKVKLAQKKNEQKVNESKLLSC